MQLLLVDAVAAAKNGQAPMPVGPVLLARAVERAGHQVRVVDLGDRRTDGTTLDAALKQPADLVGFSLFCLESPTLLERTGELVALVANAGLPTVLGGAGYSLAPKHCLRRLGADYGVSGPAEGAIVGLLEALDGGNGGGGRAPRVEVPGVLWRDPSGVVHSPPGRAAPAQLDLAVAGLAGALPALLTGRPPCPATGDWPPRTSGPRRVRRGVDELVDELRGLAEGALAGRVLPLIDPCINEQLEWAKQLLEAIIRAELPFGFVASLEPSADTDRELIGLLRRAGCLMARCRVVSPDGSAEGGRLCGYLDDHRLPFELELVLGGPGETRGSVEGAFRWLAGCDPLQVAFEQGIPLMPAFEALAARARQDGLSAMTPDDQLAEPPRYVAPDVRRAWLEQRVRRYHRWHWPRVTQRWRIALQRWSLRRAARRDL